MLGTSTADAPFLSRASLCSAWFTRVDYALLGQDPKVLAQQLRLVRGSINYQKDPAAGHVVVPAACRPPELLM